MTLEPWTIGHVPNGWTRGDPLDVWDSKVSRPQGTVWRQIQMSAVPTDNPIHADNIACMPFHHSQRAAVHAWVEWWYGKDGAA